MDSSHKWPIMCFSTLFFFPVKEEVKLFVTRAYSCRWVAGRQRVHELFIIPLSAPHKEV